MSQQPKLPSSCTIKIDGEDFEVFMSFALLNRLAFLVGNPDDVHTIMLNPEMREAVLREMISKRDKKGKITQVVEIDSVEVSLEDVQTILDFAASHVMDFTVGALQRSTALQKKNFEQILALQKQTLPSTAIGPVA